MGGGGVGCLPRGLTLPAGDAFELQEVVGNGHGKGEQLFECLAGFVEIQGNPAALQAHALGQIFEFLLDGSRRGFDQQGRMIEALLPQTGEGLRKVLAAAAFIVSVIAAGECAQVINQNIAIGQSAGADAFGNARRQDLLSAAAADAEEEFDGGAIDEGTRKGLQVLDDVVDFAVPGGFGGHRNSSC